MPGRKPREDTRAEKVREYRLFQKRSYGERVAGEEAPLLDEVGYRGGVGEIAREREQYREEP